MIYGIWNIMESKILKTSFCESLFLYNGYNVNKDHKKRTRKYLRNEICAIHSDDSFI